MTARSINRRRFLSTSGRTGLVACGACLCSRLPGWAAEDTTAPIDPKKLNFCGYRCPEDCKWVEATLKNDLELKKEAWKMWKIEDRYGVAFDPDRAFCYGCKNLDQPEGVVVSECTVRTCAREKQLDCCVECDQLDTCTHDLWKRFPEFHKGVRAAREKYLKQV